MLYGTIAADAGVEATLKVCRDSWSWTLVATANTATDAEAAVTAHDSKHYGITLDISRTTHDQSIVRFAARLADR